MQRSNDMWDELRKEARKVESEVDSKLAAYSRLGSYVGLQVGDADSGDAASEAESMATEIEKLLEQLKVIHGAMAECSRGGSSADLLNHTLARHSDILHEYTQEFVRTRKNVSATLQHAQLIGQGPRGRGAPSESSISLQQGLWRERGSIQSSTAQADEVIAQAHATALNLQQQRGTFEGIWGKAVDVSQKFPVVHNILTAIQRKKSRDNLIITAIVLICTIVIVWYWLSK